MGYWRNWRKRFAFVRQSVRAAAADAAALRTLLLPIIRYVCPVGAVPA